MTELLDRIPRRHIVGIARLWLETPYCHQASLRAVGCDCLGLVRGVYRDVYGHDAGSVPAYTSDWAEATGQETLLEAAARHLVPLLDPPRPGDVLIFRWRSGLPAKHVAILSRDTSMIHAVDGRSVAEVSFTPWWRRRLAGAFAFPGVCD